MHGILVFITRKISKNHAGGGVCGCVLNRSTEPIHHIVNSRQTTFYDEATTAMVLRFRETGRVMRDKSRNNSGVTKSGIGAPRIAGGGGMRGGAFAFGGRRRPPALCCAT